MKYLDTAYVAKLYLNEAGSGAVRQAVAQLDSVACCAHGRVELAYVFHRKYRERAMDRKGLASRMHLVEVDTAKGLLSWLPLDEALLESACSSVLTLERKVTLRAADALHLLCAKENGFKEIYSNDRHLLAGARHFGLKGIDLIRE